MNQAAAAAIRLFLVDDHAMFREGLAHVLEKEAGFQIAGQCASAAEALIQLPRSGATVVLLDVDLGSERALDFVIEAKKRGFDGHILIVTAGVSGQEAVQLVQAGVEGFFTSNTPLKLYAALSAKWRRARSAWRRTISRRFSTPSTARANRIVRGSPSAKK